jgi:hypothetical protein
MWRTATSWKTPSVFLVDQRLPDVIIATMAECHAARRRTSVIGYDYSRTIRSLPAMKTLDFHDSPLAREIAIAAHNRTAIAAHFKSQVVEPCTDTHCVVCPDHIETYAVCKKCEAMAINYYEAGILQRTVFMQDQQKKNADYKPEVDELSKSRMLWRLYYEVR